MVVLLPSGYTGGEVSVNYGSSIKVLNVAATSQHSISLLTWYSGVTRQISPVRSGFRLALSFNLTFPFPHFPIPSPPRLRTQEANLYGKLLEWAVKPPHERPSVFAHLLEGQYDKDDLSFYALDKIDAHTVSVLEGIAEGTGYTVQLAAVDGCAVSRVEPGCVPRQEYPDLCGALRSEVRLSSIVDMDGDAVFDDPTSFLTIEGRLLLPPHTLRGVPSVDVHAIQGVCQSLLYRIFVI